MHTLRCAHHDLADETRLPDARSELTVGRTRVTPLALFVGFEMLVKAEVDAHLNALHNRHPGSVKVASFWRCFARLE